MTITSQNVQNVRYVETHIRWRCFCYRLMQQLLLDKVHTAGAYRLVSTLDIPLVGLWTIVQCTHADIKVRRKLEVVFLRWVPEAGRGGINACWDLPRSWVVLEGLEEIVRKSLHQGLLWVKFVHSVQHNRSTLNDLSYRCGDMVYQSGMLVLCRYNTHRSSSKLKEDHLENGAVLCSSIAFPASPHSPTRYRKIAAKNTAAYPLRTAVAIAELESPRPSRNTQ
ncbi:hypothetical protein F5884DRAFT_166705 [Xylogone sp. PMI_703]|nr:hypothetical protein F5884DRAFT_166705 [Xylogone sp. PMI_703]